MVQNAWFKAHQAIGQFEGRAQIRTWLGRIAINESKMQLRQRAQASPFTGWHSDDESDDALADRFSHNGSWQSSPTQWDMDPPQGRLVRQDPADCVARA